MKNHIRSWDQETNLPKRHSFHSWQLSIPAMPRNKSYVCSILSLHVPIEWNLIRTLTDGIICYFSKSWRIELRGRREKLFWMNRGRRMRIQEKAEKRAAREVSLTEYSVLTWLSIQIYVCLNGHTQQISGSCKTLCCIFHSHTIEMLIIKSIAGLWFPDYFLP